MCYEQSQRKNPLDITFHKRDRSHIGSFHTENKPDQTESHDLLQSIVDSTVLYRKEEEQERSCDHIVKKKIMMKKYADETKEQQMQPAEEPKRKISFGSLQIYSFPRTLGDHPSCRSGPPISLAFEHIEEAIIDLEEHEMLKEYNRLCCRSRDDIYLSSEMRKWLLVVKGHYSMEDLIEARKDVDSIQRQREWSLKKHRLELALIKPKRKLQKILCEKKSRQ